MINGYPMSDYDINDVRAIFALFQTFAQYPFTLRENITLSDLNAKMDDNRIVTAMKLSGIYDNYDKFEKQIHT